MSHHLANEFVPAPAHSGRMTALGVVLTAFVLVPAVLAVLVVVPRPSITYRIRNSVLEIAGGTSILASHRSYPLASLTGWREVRLGRGRRTGGIGVPGLCAGYFSYDRIGKVWQVTDCSPEVLLLEVAGEDRPVLVAPPDRAAFLAALQSQHDGDFSPPAHRQPTWWLVLKGVLLIVTLPVVIYVGMAFFLAPRRLRYRLGGGELEIQLLLLRKRFPITALHVRRHTPTRALRWGGTAMPLYYAGSFSVDGIATRVYATTIEREGILLDGTPRLFVTPADIDGFLAAARANGAHVDT